MSADGEPRDLAGLLMALGQLKVHRSGNQPSLKKPVLMLVVIGRMQRGELPANQIRFSELEKEYKRALEAATGKSAGNLAEPFVRLRSSDFWQIHAPEDVQVGPVKRVLNREDVWAEFDAGT